MQDVCLIGVRICVYRCIDVCLGQTLAKSLDPIFFCSICFTADHMPYSFSYRLALMSIIIGLLPNTPFCAKLIGKTVMDT